MKLQGYSVLRHVFFTLCLFLFTVLTLSAQTDSTSKKLDSLYAELDLLFADSGEGMDYLLLADSLMMKNRIKYHAVMARIAYMGEVSSAGRVEDINTFGLSAGASYFHPSGLFVDVNGFYNNAYQPKYFMTSASLGYFSTFWDKLSTSLSHDFYFYNDTLESQPFDKALTFSNFWSENFIEAGIDYTLLYGKSSAHRLTAVSNLRKSWKFNGFIDAVTLFPGAAFQWGNADIVYYKQSDTPIRDLLYIINSSDYPSLTNRQNLYLAQLLLEERYAASALLLRRNGYSNQQIQSILSEYDQGQLNQVNAFGLMNISIQFPISLSFSSYSLLLNYTHNFPKALPGESYTYEDNGFISISFSYFLFKTSYDKRISRLIGTGN